MRICLLHVPRRGCPRAVHGVAVPGPPAGQPGPQQRPGPPPVDLGAVVLRLDRRSVGGLAVFIPLVSSKGWFNPFSTDTLLKPRTLVLTQVFFSAVVFGPGEGAHLFGSWRGLKLCRHQGDSILRWGCLGNLSL